jgi:ribonuclease P protein component
LYARKQKAVVAWWLKDAKKGAKSSLFNMLARKNRVKRPEFEGILQKSAVFHTAYFSLRVKQGSDAANSHAAVVASKKVAASAAERNLLKRRGRAILSGLLPHLSPQTSIILFYKKEGVKIPFVELKETVTKACKQYKLIS